VGVGVRVRVREVDLFPGFELVLEGQTVQLAHAGLEPERGVADVSAHSLPRLTF
jgi:hypothetical protein